ncbi:hypothetical protein Tco_1250937 [Tanacetum coccineum]
MFEVSKILEDDSTELVSGEANRLGASLSMEVEEEEDASAVSDESRVAAEMGVDTTLGDLKYSSKRQDKAQVSKSQDQSQRPTNQIKK